MDTGLGWAELSVHLPHMSMNHACLVFPHQDVNVAMCSQNQEASGRRKGKASRADLLHRPIVAHLECAAECMKIRSAALDQAQLDLNTVTQGRNTCLADTLKKVERVQKDKKGCIIRIYNFAVRMLAGCNKLSAHNARKMEKKVPKPGAMKFNGLNTFYGIGLPKAAPACGKNTASTSMRS